MLVNVGSLLDFAIDPTGTTSPRDPSIYNARADGTDFTASLATHQIPEPASLWLMLTGFLGFALARRNLAVVLAARSTRK